MVIPSVKATFMSERLDLGPIKKRLTDARWAEETDQMSSVELWVPFSIADLYRHAATDIAALITEVEYWKDKYMNPSADGL